VVVVREAQTGGPCLLREGAEEICSSLPVVGGLSSPLFRKPGQRRPLVTDCLCISEHGGRLLEHVDRDMRRRRREPVLLKQVSDLRGSAPEISGEFDFLVPGGRDLGEGARHVLLHQIANGVELQSDLVDFPARGNGGASRGGVDTGESKRSGADRRKEVAAGL
jgi:hypothetical protein